MCDIKVSNIMGLIQLLFSDPLTFVLLAIPLLYSIIIHELAHGWVAYKMGDSTAKWLGRLSLNPIRHLDPIGTAALFLVGFGWAKPVPVNFANLRDSEERIDFCFSGRDHSKYYSCFFILSCCSGLFSPLPSDRIFTHPLYHGKY